MDQDEAVDQVMNFIIQGFSPLAKFIEFSLLCLGLYPEWQVILKDEMNEVFSKNSKE